jgi:nicotinamidase-related amidase
MNTALLIVDMQNSFVDEQSSFAIRGARKSVPKLVELLEWARSQGWFVVHVVREYQADASDVELPRRESFLRQGGCAIRGTWGAQIIGELTPATNEAVLVKPRFSGFFQTSLDSLLRRNRVGRVVVAGTQYPNCIRATAFDALSLDYGVWLATDATSAQSDGVAQANIHDLSNIGIACCAVAELKLALS